MRYFLKLSSGVQVMPIMESLARRPNWWNEDRTRTEFEGTPHAEVDDILLRFGEPDGDNLEAEDLPTMMMLRGAKELSLGVMQMVGGSRLGRVVITRLAPGKRILPHSDVKGKYTEYYTRYHVVLQGLPGSLFICGDETVNMQSGEIWWFDAHAEHAVMNNSADDRIHMLVDVRIDQ